ALAVLYAFWKCNKDFGLTTDQVIDYLIWGTIVAIVGARTYYVVFNFDNFKDDLLSVFAIWEGGIAIYGAVIGASLVGFLLSRKKKLNPYKILDLAAIGFLIGQIIGRWGNFVNVEAYGKAFTSQNPADLPFWAMGIGYPATYVHPIFLYESLWNLLGLVLIFILVKPRRRFGGQIALFYAGWYGFGRFFTEGIRGGDELYLFGTNLRVSQVLAAILFLGSAIVFIWKYSHPEAKGPIGLSPMLPKDWNGSPEEKVVLLYPEIEVNTEDSEVDQEETESEDDENGNLT
ncbi:MAG: prolipoprotein diacylglyceryl transferase, partial [Clostridia bacterium]|nr:prolipoprotein diacylglyceryl transferase [Clostridia bacterium]